MPNNKRKTLAYELSDPMLSIKSHTHSSQPSACTFPNNALTMLALPDGFNFNCTNRQRLCVSDTHQVKRRPRRLRPVPISWLIFRGTSTNCAVQLVNCLILAGRIVAPNKKTISQAKYLEHQIHLNLYSIFIFISIRIIASDLQS